MNLHGKNFIGEHLSTGTNETFAVTSPLDGSVLPGNFHVAGAAEVDAALRAADTAFAVFADTPADMRAHLLDRIADDITAIGDELLQRAHRETGLPLARLAGERTRTVNQLRMFAQVAREESWLEVRIDPAQPDRQPAPRPDLRRMLRPIGPVVVFGASNFPLAFSVAGGDTASALATGNPVVVKAHERHPGTSELVAEAIRRAVIACRLPAGVFSLLHGTGQVVGRALVQHPLTRAVAFTGSRTAGRALFDAAVTRPVPVPMFAEMSSLNPVFILPGALRERGAAIASGLCGSVTLGVGQFCTKPGIVFGLDGPEFARFLNHFAEHLRAVAPATMLHAGISESYRRLLARAEALSAARPLARASSGDPTKTHGEAVALQIDVPAFVAHPEIAEEVFGPFAWIITAQSPAELERAAEHLEGQLTATVHGTPDDLRDAAPLLRILERKAGRLIVNGVPTGVEVSPAMHHGGPYPATTDVRFTSVGTAALLRFVRPVCYQDFPPELLPPALRDENPHGLWRMIDGRLTQAALAQGTR